MLDVNLLVSLAWPNHVHHQPALAWFCGRAGQPWATTPVTEAGFVRVSSNVSAIPSAVTPGEAIVLLQRMRDVADHQFLPDDVALVVGEYLSLDQIATYRQVTDAHLLAVARRHGVSLARLDRGLASLGRGVDSMSRWWRCNNKTPGRGTKNRHLSRLRGPGISSHTGFGAALQGLGQGAGGCLPTRRVTLDGVREVRAGGCRRVAMFPNSTLRPAPVTEPWGVAQVVVAKRRPGARRRNAANLETGGPPGAYGL